MFPRTARDLGADRALSRQLHWERHGFDSQDGERVFNYTPGWFGPMWCIPERDGPPPAEPARAGGRRIF